MLFTQPWRAAALGDTYARDFYVGDEVPKELEDAAVRAYVAKRVRKPAKNRRKNHPKK